MAVAVLMGRQMDSVVVRTLAIAKECVEMLKKDFVEPMEFIPLNTISVRAFIVPGQCCCSAAAHLHCLCKCCTNQIWPLWTRTVQAPPFALWLQMLKITRASFVALQSVMIANRAT